MQMSVGALGILTLLQSCKTRVVKKSLTWWFYCTWVFMGHGFFSL